MITGITGMPGDGKSLFAVAMPMFRSLIQTERYCVTNIRMRIPNLHEVVSKEREKLWKKGSMDPWEWDVDKRIRVISDQEAFEFFRFRSGGLVLPHSPDFLLREEEERNQNQLRLDKRAHDAKMLEIFNGMNADPAFKRGVDYFIDEAHDIFPSREWALGGRGVLYYTSKHRHLHDEIYLITQQIDQMEKQLRNLISETVVVRNQLRRNIGPVKMRPCFTTRFYYGQVTPNAKPFMTPKMFLDLEGAAKCYRTAGALGVHDSPETIKNKGWLPWWVLPVGGVCIVAAVIAAFVGLPYIGAMLGKKMVGASQEVIHKVAGPKPTAKDDLNALTDSPPGRTPDTVRQPVTASDVGAKVVHAVTGKPKVSRFTDAAGQPLKVRGSVRSRDGTFILTLSDGSVVTEKDGVVTNIDERTGRATVEGQNLSPVGVRTPPANSVAVNAKQTTGAANPSTVMVAPLSDYEKYGERGAPMPSHMSKLGPSGEIGLKSGQ